MNNELAHQDAKSIHRDRTHILRNVQLKTWNAGRTRIKNKTPRYDK